MKASFGRPSTEGNDRRNGLDAHLARNFGMIVDVHLDSLTRREAR